MALERRANERWGFETNCFVCEPRNPLGLRIAFFHDTDAHEVVATPTFGPEHSGAPSYVHGGVQLAVLDEAMAWAAIALAGRFAVTATFTSAFRRPVRVGTNYRVAARLSPASADATTLEASSHIVAPDGEVCTEATGTLVVLSEAHAVDAGVVVSEPLRNYLT